MTRQQIRQRYRHVYREQTAQERYWQPRIKQALDRMLLPVYKSLNDFGVEITLRNLNSLILPGTFADTLQRLYVRAGVMAANSEYGHIMAVYGEELGITKAFGFNRFFADLMRTFFNLVGGAKITSITDTERERVRVILEQAAEEALPPRETAKLLRSDDINIPRSKLIARTELSAAMNQGAHEGAKRTGVILDSVWISTLNDRTRRMPRDQANHLVMNEVKIPFGGLFEVPSKKGITLMRHPGDPSAPPYQICNCRCRAISVARRDSSGRLMRV